MSEKRTSSAADINKIIQDAKSVFSSNIVEIYAFKVDWYNNLVAPKYKLDYKNDTVALIFFTIPYVFNESFIPFLCNYKEMVVHKSWEKFIHYNMEKVQQMLKKEYHLKIPDEDIMYSFDTECGHAKILVQTAGHIAAGAYYYQRRDVIPDPWPKNKTIYGVSIHPLYGGYFSLDAVIILRNIYDPKMIKKPPPDVVKSHAKRVELLTLYNDYYQNQKWRDIIPVQRKYTDEHMKYVMTYGEERENYVKRLINGHCRGRQDLRLLYFKKYIFNF
ncbi:MMACHC [Acanthosepion pharaonis]|uniref:Cyanocobalamin reductase (cyanide-eliminating) n=1 Tax=Acanthosepion pharaonis TaxID=158019 RepID=A0A812B869_ACAPH|nr:MMACHC [Sepia pharaonis]